MKYNPLILQFQKKIYFFQYFSNLTNTIFIKRNLLYF